jgi:hypothetical protein
MIQLSLFFNNPTFQKINVSKFYRVVAFVVGVKSSASWTCFLFTFPNFVLEYILLISFGRNLRTKMFHGVNSSTVLLSNHFITLIFHPGRKKYCHKIYSWSKTKLFNVTYLDFLVPLNATLGLYICMVTE